VILDGTLLRIDRVGMTGGHDRPFYSGKHKCHGLNVQVIADRAGRLIWISTDAARSPARHGRCSRTRDHQRHRHRRGARGGRHRLPGRRIPRAGVPQHRRRIDPDTGRYQRLSRSQKEVNAAHARQRGPGERANAELNSWKILRKIRSSPSRGTELVQAAQTLIIAST